MVIGLKRRRKGDSQAPSWVGRKRILRKNRGLCLKRLINAEREFRRPKSLSTRDKAGSLFPPTRNKSGASITQERMEGVGATKKLGGPMRGTQKDSPS